MTEDCESMGQLANRVYV